MNVQGKRKLVDETNPLPKRVKVESRGIFDNVPHEVMMLIISKISKTNLLQLGQTCKAFYQFAEDRFSEFRNVQCLKRQTANYFLTQTVIRLIASLGQCTYPICGPMRKSVEPVCKHVPEFDALVKLIQLKPKEQVPPELITKLNTEEVFSVIKDIYLFSRSIYEIQHQKGKKQVRIQEIQLEQNNFKNNVHPKIEMLFQEGAIYIAAITTNIFYRFFLISKKKNDPFAAPIAANLALSAKSAGDGSSLNQLIKLKVPLSSYVVDSKPENVFVLARDKFLLSQDKGKWKDDWPNFWLKKNELALILADKQLNDVEIQTRNEEYLKLAQFPDEVGKDPSLVCAIFKFHLQSQNWEEAHKFSDKVQDWMQDKVKKNGTYNSLELYVQCAITKVSENLGKYEETCRNYEKLLVLYDGLPPSFFSYVEFSVYAQFTFSWIVIDYTQLALNACDWERVEKIMNHVLKKDGNYKDGNYIELDNSWDAFVTAKRRLNKVRDADKWDALHFVLRNEKNADAQFFDALGVVFHQDDFFDSFSKSLMIKLAAILFNIKCYEKVDFLYERLCRMTTFNELNVGEQEVFILTKINLNQLNEADLLFEMSSSNIHTGITVKLARQDQVGAIKLGYEKLKDFIDELQKCIKYAYGELGWVSVSSLTYKIETLVRAGMLPQITPPKFTLEDICIQSYIDMVDMFLQLDETEIAYEIYKLASQIYGSDQAQAIHIKIDLYIKFFTKRS